MELNIEFLKHLKSFFILKGMNRIKIRNFLQWCLASFFKHRLFSVQRIRLFHINPSTFSYLCGSGVQQHIGDSVKKTPSHWFLKTTTPSLGLWPSFGLGLCLSHGLLHYLDIQLKMGLDMIRP